MRNNTMVTLSRMGCKTGWVSRLKKDAFGQRIEKEIHGFGVDTSRIIWTDKDRNEVFYVESEMETLKWIHSV